MATAAEGLATRVGFALPQSILWEHLDDFVLVGEDELRRANAAHARAHAQPRRASRRRTARRRAAAARAARRDGAWPRLQRREHDARAARGRSSRRLSARVATHTGPSQGLRSLLRCAGVSCSPSCSHASRRRSRSRGHGSADAGQPVPSLEPRETQSSSRSSVTGRSSAPTAWRRTAARCVPSSTPPSDWLRLATRLAANASPCAQYYVSVPPVVGQKTRASARPGDADPRARAAVPRARRDPPHDVAEVGREHRVDLVPGGRRGAPQHGRRRLRRRRRATRWAVNELTSAIRRGDGAKRAEIRDFLRGLYDAGGEGPPTKGVVFVVGIGQRVARGRDVQGAHCRSGSRTRRSGADVNAYVSDWSQEVYGDVRGYAAPGADAATRRDALVDYLRHSDLLAGAGGGGLRHGERVLRATSSPVANAAWQWDSAFGWTDVSIELMQQYVSAQVYALRNHSVRTGQPTDHWGFAWAPRNPRSRPFDDLPARTRGSCSTGSRTAIRDSQTVVPDDPGVNACADGPLLRRRPRGRVRRHAAGARSGRGRRRRSASRRRRRPSAQESSRAPIGLQVQVAARRGASRSLPWSRRSPPRRRPAPSRRAPAGPFAPTVSVAAPRRGVRDGPALLPGHDGRDRDAERHPAPASSTGTQPFTVSGAPPVSLRVDPPSATVVAGGDGDAPRGRRRPVRQRARPRSRGRSSRSPAAPSRPRPAPTASFVASSVPGTGTVTATLTTPAASLTATAALTVRPPPAVRVSAVRYGVARGRLLVFTTVVDTRGRRVRNASVTVALSRNGKGLARGRRTHRAGRMTFDRPASTARTARASPGSSRPGSPGAASTPANSFTKRPARSGKASPVHVRESTRERGENVKRALRRRRRAGARDARPPRSRRSRAPGSSHR